jgi:hypothetical protein
MMVAGASTITIGTPFDHNGVRDLAFQFLQDGQSTPTAGLVVYEAFPAGTADFDSDGDVDGADFLRWQRNVGAAGAAATLANGNANGDGVIDAADLAVWREQYGNVRPSAAAAVGAIPEPAAWLLGLMALMSGRYSRRRPDARQPSGQRPRSARCSARCVDRVE